MTLTKDDPLAERTGPCDHCDHGWVQVKPAYATHLFPDPGIEQLAGLTDEQVEAVHASIAERRGAAANSVYPCRECSRPMFFRWAGGHFKLGHDVLGCDECIEVLGGRRAARRAARALPDNGPASRKDTDG